MRITSILPLFGAATLARAQYHTKPTEPTQFNGVEVPPLLELTPATHDDEVKSTEFTMVKYHRYNPPSPPPRRSRSR